jgi:hypothetical protein
MGPLFDAIAKFVEREAGHIMVSLLLVLIGYWLWCAKFSKGEDVVMFALGVLSRSMIGHAKPGNEK